MDHIMGFGERDDTFLGKVCTELGQSGSISVQIFT